MIVDAILAGLIFYLMFPLLTGYCASQYGRSFGRWFAFGCVLPIISFFILFGLISWNEKATPRHKFTRRERKESEKLVAELLTNASVEEVQIAPSQRSPENRKVDLGKKNTSKT
ncbi:MAG: hypothetical protein HRT61_23515 [Ekhidna sp.]|nr:hypothetical protein [Ekhidna sp.]